MTYISRCIYLYWIYAANNYMLYLCISQFVFLYLCIKHLGIYFWTSLNQQFAAQKHWGPNFPTAQFATPTVPRGPICQGPICRWKIFRGQFCRDPIWRKESLGAQYAEIRTLGMKGKVNSTETQNFALEFRVKSRPGASPDLWLFYGGKFYFQKPLQVLIGFVPKVYQK